MMLLKNAFARMMMLALSATLLAACVETPPIPDFRNAITAAKDASVTVPFLLDDNRMFLPIAFTAPDGQVRKVLAFVNMGSGAFVLTNKLYRDLGIGEGHALRMQLGAMQLSIAPGVVQPEDQANSISLSLNPFHKPKSSAEIAKAPGGSMAKLAAPLDVEAIIPPGLLAQFEVVFDYGAKTITLAPPATLKPDGIAVPIRVNPRSGFATLDLIVDGKTYPMVLDNGGSYSAVLGSCASDWSDAHPSWLRSIGAIGESNIVMDGQIDVNAPVLKIPDAKLGLLKLEELGVMSPTIGGPLGGIVTHLFAGWYSDKAGEPVNGWIAGNVLESYRVTLDYRNHESYWLQESPLDSHDLDQVGITLKHLDGVTSVAGIAKKSDIDTVSGVMVDDMILAIDSHPTAPMTRGELLSALHGKPGDRHTLALKRDGEELTVDVPVTGF